MKRETYVCDLCGVEASKMRWMHFEYGSKLDPDERDGMTTMVGGFAGHACEKCWASKVDMWRASFGKGIASTCPT